MRIELPDDDARRLARLTKQAESARRAATGRAESLSGSAWVRGAVRVASSDADVARLIAQAAPSTGHGGRRAGAGRPRDPRTRREADRADQATTDASPPTTSQEDSHEPDADGGHVGR